MMMKSFCGMIDQRKVFNLVFSCNQCQRFSQSQISDTLPVGFESALNEVVPL